MGDKSTKGSDTELDLRPMTDGAPSAALVRAITLAQAGAGPEADGRWRPGPLPIVQPPTAESQARGLMRATTNEARRTLVAEQPAEVLYSSERLHDLTPSTHGDVLVLARELWLDPTRTWGFLVVHVTTAPSETRTLAHHLDTISPLLRTGEHAVQDFWVEAGGAEHWTFDDARIRAVSFADATDSPAPPLEEAYALVSGATTDTLPDLAERATQHELTIARTDWSALVLRDGVGFVAHQVTSDPFVETLRMLAHSTHLDALLLALVQRHLVDESSAESVRIPLDPDALGRLEKEHFDFKRRVWRTALTDKRNSPGDSVLAALQDQLLTQADLHDVEERVRTGARLARSLRDERSAAAQAQLERTVQTASVVIGSFALAYTAAAVIADPGWLVFLLATLVGLVATSVAFAFLRVTGRRADGARPEAGGPPPPGTTA